LGSKGLFSGSIGVVEVALRDEAASRPAAGRPSRREIDEPVEIIAPDRVSAATLVDLVGSAHPFELVGTESSWVVRVQPVGPAGKSDLLLLVERWLAICPLPCATIVCAGRRYIVRSTATRCDRVRSSMPPASVSSWFDGGLR
jgi:hypothetical protein